MRTAKDLFKQFNAQDENVRIEAKTASKIGTANYRNKGMPKGAYRRIGSTDQHCTEDDLHVFYQGREGYDSSILRETSMDDLDPKAIERYRSLRENVNPFAAELEYDDELLSDSQKRALIFLRKVGAIDNPTFRQLSDLDVLKASGELRNLRDKKLIQQKGKDYLKSES